MAKLPALPYVRAGLSQGLSANAAFRDYRTQARENGLSANRRQDFLRLYSQTSRLRGQAAEAIDAPKDVPGGGLRPVQRDTEQARGFGHWVAIFQRTSGTSDFISTPFLIKSATLLTPAEAEARALAYLEQEPDTYNRTTLGVTFTGVERFAPRADQ